MKMYNLSAIMRNAHAIRKLNNTSMSLALCQAWQSAKLPKSVNEKQALTDAFLTKYPTGKITIHQFWMGATVQFNENGKVYTFRGHGWIDRLNVGHKAA